jgi:hypothetical protein
MTDFVGYWEAPGMTDNLLWDAPIDWSTGIGSSLGNLSAWLNKITPNFQTKPDFMNTVALTLQPLADALTQISLIPSLYDLDTAVGAQLDTVGEWVQASRFIQTPATGVYFAFDTGGVGFNQGTWLGPYDPTTALTRLGDDTYRNVIRAQIAANGWDGSLTGLYAAWNNIFAGSSARILIQDIGGMHMLYALYGDAPDAITLALFTQGLFATKPAAVQIDAFVTPSVASTPFFGFGVTNSVIAGFNAGAWGTVNPGI